MKISSLILTLAALATLMLCMSGQYYAAFVSSFIGMAAAVPWSAHNARVFALNGSLSLLDLAKANCNDVTAPIVESAVGTSPEMTQIAANQLGAGELSYQTLTRTGYPSAGFHDVGSGLVPSKSGVALKIFECFPFGGRIEAIKHIADNWKRGGMAGYFSFESLGIMKAALFSMAKQIWYGRGGANGKGFPGLKNFTSFGSTVTDPLTAKVYNMTINAGGTTANTASSCYLVISGEQNIELQLGTGSPFELPEPRIGDGLDKDGNKVESYISVLQGWAGLATPNLHCVRRIVNLTEDDGKGMTDALLAKAIKEFPANTVPTAIFMSRLQQYQLQISRTVVLQGAGSERPDQPKVAPLPIDYSGIPIFVTDAIGDTDAIETTAGVEE